MSMVTARTVRRHRHKFSRDLVLHGIGKSTFRKYWNFKVLEMALKTFHFVQGLSRTPLLFVPRNLATRFPKNSLQQTNKFGNHISENLKFKNPGSLTSAQLEQSMSSLQLMLTETRPKCERCTDFRFSIFIFISKICSDKYVGEISRDK